MKPVGQTMYARLKRLIAKENDSLSLHQDQMYTPAHDPDTCARCHHATGVIHGLEWALREIKRPVPKSTRQRYINRGLSPQPDPTPQPPAGPSTAPYPDYL